MRRPALLVVLLASGLAGGHATGEETDMPELARIHVRVAGEDGDAVHLQVRVPPDVVPGSIEVRFRRRKLVVLAETQTGGRRRSPAVLLPAAVSEEGVTADYESDGWLTVTLPKAAAARAEGAAGANPVSPLAGRGD